MRDYEVQIISKVQLNWRIPIETPQDKFYRDVANNELQRIVFDLKQKFEKLIEEELRKKLE